MAFNKITNIINTKINNQKVGGLGHGILQRGRVVGLRGNKVDPRLVAQTTTGQVEPHGIRLNNVQRGIRKQNTTAGENNLKIIHSFFSYSGKNILKPVFYRCIDTIFLLPNQFFTY